MSEPEYETAQERTIALADAEAASRRAESETAVKRSMAERAGSNSDMKSAFREALKEEIEAQKEEARIRETEAPRDLSGTAPTLSDSAGNYAPNPEVANAGGIGVEDSNTNPETGEQAQTAKEAGTPPEEAIPADWEGSHWRTRVALAEKISGRDDVKTEEANSIIAAEVARRG